MLPVPPLSNLEETIGFLLSQVREILDAEEVALHPEGEGPLWVYKNGNTFLVSDRPVRLGGIYVPLQHGGWLIVVNPKKEFNEEILRQYCSRVLENAKKYTALEKCVTLDPLTGIYNRSALYARLQEEVVRGGNFCVIFLDVNDFKQVNDCLGHLAGDEVLKRAVQALKSGLRSQDFLARYAGDEFVAVLSRTTRWEAEKIARRLGEQKVHAGSGITVTFAWGLAVYPHDADNIEELLQCADRRMYEQKAQMKGEVIEK